MTTKKEILSEKTHKSIEKTSKRIYYTLTAYNTVDTYRIAKTVALLLERLEDEGIANDDDIDKMLIEVVS